MDKEFLKYINLQRDLENRLGLSASSLKTIDEFQQNLLLSRAGSSRSQFNDELKKQSLWHLDAMKWAEVRRALRHADFAQQLNRVAEESALLGYRKLIDDAMPPLQELKMARGEFAGIIEQFAARHTQSALQAHSSLERRFLDAIEGSKSLLESLLPQSKFQQLAGEFHAAQRLAGSDEWAAVVENLRNSIRTGETTEPVSLFDEVYASAKNVYESKGREGKGRVQGLRDWIAFVISIYAFVLALSGDADISDIKAQQKIERALLVELRQEIRKLEAQQEKKFIVIDRPTVVYAKPESGARKVGELKPMQSVIQIEHQSKWIRVEFHDKGRQSVGWVLKKYLERLPHEPEYKSE